MACSSARFSVCLLPKDWRELDNSVAIKLKLPKLIDHTMVLVDTVGRLECYDVNTVETALASDIPLRLVGLIAVAYDIAPGSVAAYYPEANALVPISHRDTQSGTPSYKSVPVRITSSRRAAPVSD